MYENLNLNVTQIESESIPGLRTLIQDNVRFDLIYIDGHHEHMTPTVDFGLSYSLLNRGGIIMLDDHHWDDVRPLKRLCDKHLEKIHESWKIATYRMN